LYSLYSDSVNDKLFIGGAFKYYGNSLLKGVAQWDGFQIQNMDCGLGGCGNGICGGVREFKYFKGELFALFYEDSIGCQNIQHVAKWNGSNWINLNQNYFLTNSPVHPSRIQDIDTVMFVCGGFDSVYNYKTQGIVQFNGISWSSSLSCSLFTNSYLLVHPIYKFNNEIYAQNFLIDTLGNRQIFSRWRNGCWEKVPGAFSNISGNIWKMIEYKNELYIAGSFDPLHDPMAPGYSIVRWDGTRWDDLNGGIRLSNPSYLPFVYDLAVFNNELYVFGYFQKAGSLDVSNIAKWDGFNWCSLGSTFDREISCAVFYHDSLFIGGIFKKINNDSITYFAKSYVGNYTDTCEQVISTDEIKNFPIHVFPNPVYQKMQVENERLLFSAFIIIDLSGRHILYSKVNSRKLVIDLSEISSGVYFLHLETKEGRVVKKFVKE
jgi:Secretion system C-terminal sorting domain